MDDSPRNCGRRAAKASHLDLDLMSPHVLNRTLTQSDLPVVSALHARVFGPGRFARTAYRVREGTGAMSPYCRAAFLGDQMIAAVRMTAITIGGNPGALLLGPLVVDPKFAGQGFGKALVGEAIQDAKDKGVQIVVLVGDEPYYGRFGFKPVPLGQIMLPGPVDPARILAAELTESALTTMRGVVAAVR